MNLEKVVPSLDELVDHFRAQATWKGPPPPYWIVKSHKNKKEIVEPKIEFVSPLAQEIKRAESEVKDMKKRGEPLPVNDTIVRLKSQSVKKINKTRGKKKTYTRKRNGKSKTNKLKKGRVIKTKKLKGWKKYK